MVFCVTFELSDEITNPLHAIFQGLPCQKCRLYIPDHQCEVYDKSFGSLFDSEWYDYSDFSKKILEKHDLIFIKVQATYDSCADMKTLSEFLESDCELILLVNDSKYVEIFVKQAKQAEEIYAYFVSRFNDVQLLSHGEIERTKFDVL